MASVDPPSKACSYCVSLMLGTLSDPHQYLMASARAAQSLFYRCLVCDSNLTCELEDWVPRWRSHGANPRPSMQK